MRENDRLLEMSGETATFVLSGTVSLSDVSSMRLACREIPARIRTLRLNLGDVDGLDAQVMDAVRGVVRDWRASREGVRLCRGVAFAGATRNRDTLQVEASRLRFSRPAN